MTLSAPLLRGLAVLALGTTLALGHIAFAAAAALPKQATQSAATVQKASDVETTGSTAGHHGFGENCYVETQPVRGIRGKTVMLRVEECD